MPCWPVHSRSVDLTVFSYPARGAVLAGTKQKVWAPDAGHGFFCARRSARLPPAKTNGINTPAFSLPSRLRVYFLGMIQIEVCGGGRGGEESMTDESDWTSGRNLQGTVTAAMTAFLPLFDILHTWSKRKFSPVGNI